MPRSQIIRNVVLILAAATVVLVGVAAGSAVALGGKVGLGWGVSVVFAAVIVLAIAYWATRATLRPLFDLISQTEQLAHSDSVAEFLVAGNDEFAQIASSFNQMQHKLARRVAELQENSQTMQTVLGSMAEGVIAVATDKTVLFANAASRRLLGFPRGEPVGRPLLELTRERLISESAAAALETEGDIVRELETSGLPRRMLSLRVTRLPGNPCPGAVVVLHDISEIRRLESLRQEFVANVSHELKTPLAAVKAYAETLRMGAINDPEINLKFLGRIEEQADRLHELIVDLLQIARIEAGQEAFDVVEVPLAEMIERARAQFSDSAAARKIELSAALPAADLCVRSDEEAIRTILNNLVDNAIKYTPDGGRVEIACTTQDGWATLEVRDTGMGIAERDQARVFERFYRADKARSREMGGTGLGLAIVKHLTQAFGGHVSLESQLRKGSVFRVTLPRA